MTKVLVVADMALREMSRRRTVLLILLLLPLAFYLTRRGDHLGQSVRFVCLGLAWAQSTAALFAGSAARGIEPRLRRCGYRAGHLLAGRLVALWLLGVALSLPYLALVGLDQRAVRLGPVAVAMALTVVVSAALGLLLSAVLPRELEGTLVLLALVGLQMMMNPAGTAAHALPFWFSRELVTYSVDHTDVGYLHRGVLDGVVVGLVLTAATAAAVSTRLRRRAHLHVVA